MVVFGGLLWSGIDQRVGVAAVAVLGVVVLGGGVLGRDGHLLVWLVLIVVDVVLDVIGRHL